MAVRILKNPIRKSELVQIASEEFGDVVKAVVDVEQEIMTIGGELHADGEVELMEKENSQREHTWGINLYPKKTGSDWIEFDSMINLKPSFGNRSRDVEDHGTREKIKTIVAKYIHE